MVGVRLMREGQKGYLFLGGLSLLVGLSVLLPMRTAECTAELCVCMCTADSDRLLTDCINRRTAIVLQAFQVGCQEGQG